MKYLGKFNEDISKKKYDSLGGFTPNYKLLDKLEKRISELEKK